MGCLLSRFTFSLLLVIAFSSLSFAQRPSAEHREGLRQNKPSSFALTGAKIVVSPDKTIPQGTIVVRHGKIESVAAGVAVPAGVVAIDVAGKTIYPGLIDGLIEQSIDTAKVAGSSPYWNTEIRPQASVAQQWSPNTADFAKLRQQGFTAALIAPGGGIVKGQSCFGLLNEGPSGDVLLNNSVAQHIRLTLSRGRGSDYPNSPMGAVALARQSFYDAQWYHQANQMVSTNPALPLPAHDDALHAMGSYIKGEAPVVFDTSNETFVLRADRFAREFGLNYIIRGSGNEYRRLKEIAELERTILLPVNFPQPPNVATVEAALDASLESLMHWDIAPENPARLAAAGVELVLCSHGLNDKSDFMKRIRQSVERGLSNEAALRSLTTTPAKLFGVDDQVGTLDAGKLANMVITDGDLFDSKTKVIETWIAGKRFENDQEALRSPIGKWQLESQLQKGKIIGLLLEIKGSKSKITGTINTTSKKAKAEEAVKLSRLGMQDTLLSGSFLADKLGVEGVVRFTMVLEEPGSDSQAQGNIIWPDGQVTPMVASRLSESNKDNKTKEKGTDKREASSPADLTNKVADEEKGGDSKKQNDSSKKSSYAVNFPLGAFGRDAAPVQAGPTLFKNVTIWTSGPAGNIENGMLLIAAGKIVSVGKEITDRPAGTRVVDGKGWHLTPGLIDCHSHMATDGGVNESGQAVTAEVRIGDFINCDDINIYRQLAGGVTSSNILHGSANPIGGQNQVIKLRWSELSDAMRFKRAPAGIKYALGENVKQSNRGDDYTTRYPQTRMGVEQIVRDEFVAAREYAASWKRWNDTRKGLPPRRNLELDAIVEVLDGDRWIHCHSYRQDEILALLRTLDDFDVTIGTLQHILEGYKVADAMRKHGAMGSTFSDWWAYKVEVTDAIPFNGALMHGQGIVVSYNSDDRELARHLNQEAAKATKYGGVSPQEALKFVTLNPAKQLRIEQYVGSIEPGKDADIVLWSENPLSNFARCEQTWIDGRKYFDRTQDQSQRAKFASMRNRLIQKILASGEEMRAPGEGDGDPSGLWPSHDEFCGHHHHDDE